MTSTVLVVPFRGTPDVWYVAEIILVDALAVRVPSCWRFHHIRNFLDCVTQMKGGAGSERCHSWLDVTNSRTTYEVTCRPASWK